MTVGLFYIRKLAIPQIGCETIHHTSIRHHNFFWQEWYWWAIPHPLQNHPPATIGKSF